MVNFKDPDGLAGKLLRVVWVYLDHGGEGRGIDQGELPIEYAKELYTGNHDDPKEFEKKVDKGKRLSYEHVVDALEQLEEIFKDVGNVDPRFKNPWPKSNPCAGPRPKYRA
jgi:hypothetical protein